MQLPLGVFIVIVGLSGLGSAQFLNNIFNIINSRRCRSLPPRPPNGRFEFVGGSRNLPSSTVRYTCNEGFELVGLNFNECRNRRWRFSSPPTCRVKNPCRPRNPCRLYETCTPIYFPRTTFRCNCRTGYLRNKYGRCARRCLPPFAWSNADYTPRKSEYAEFDRITWTCNDGYNERKSGVISQTCNYGLWGSGSPTCLQNGCRPPITPPNGDFTPKRPFYAQGDHILYSCNDGFQLDDTASVRCGNANSFVDLPQCIAACPSPVPPEGGAVAPDDKAHFLEGEQVMYSCPNNTMLVGDDTGTCTDHVFPPPPNCTAIPTSLAEERNEGSGV